MMIKKLFNIQIQSNFDGGSFMTHLTIETENNNKKNIYIQYIMYIYCVFAAVPNLFAPKTFQPVSAVTI